MWMRFLRVESHLDDFIKCILFTCEVNVKKKCISQIFKDLFFERCVIR